MRQIRSNNKAGDFPVKVFWTMKATAMTVTGMPVAGIDRTLSSGVEIVQWCENPAGPSENGAVPDIPGRLVGQVRQCCAWSFDFECKK